MINQKKLRWSGFTHVLERSGVSALYNALNMKPIFVSPDMVLPVRAFGSGRSLSEVCQGMSESLSVKLFNALPFLEDTKILVDSKSSDEDILRYFQSNLTGHPYISIMYLILTDMCNFGCRYCFVENRMPLDHRYQTMNSETADKALGFFCRAINLQPEFFKEEKTIILYGGEPLMNSSVLTHVLSRIKERKEEGSLPEKTSISLITNGSLVTKEIARIIKEYNVSVAVSIDGNEGSTNSARQYKDGGPVFHDILKGLRVLQEEGVAAGISCTLSQESVDNFEQTLETILETFKVKSLGFNTVLTGNGYKVSNEYDMKAAKAVIRAFERFRKEGVFEDRIMRKVGALTDGRMYPFDCGAAGGGQIVVAPDGNIGICHGYLGDRKYFVTSVDDLSFDPRKDEVFKEWSLRSPLNMEQCAHCIALGICGGGCPLNADRTRGSIWELDERFCVHSKTILEWLIWDVFDNVKGELEECECEDGIRTPLFYLPISCNYLC